MFRRATLIRHPLCQSKGPARCSGGAFRTDVSAAGVGSGVAFVADGQRLVASLEHGAGVLATVARPDVRLGAHPLDHVRVVQLERRTLGADARQLGEVVPRRRAGGGPLERVAVAPRVVDGDDLAVPVALEDVPDERQRRGTEDERERSSRSCSGW